jgi:hypothetical protein
MRAPHFETASPGFDSSPVPTQFPASALQLVHQGDFFLRSVAAIVRRFWNYARFEISVFAAVEHRRLVANAIEDVFIDTEQGSAPQIRSVAVGAERNQISGGALPALDAMADERHRCNSSSQWRIVLGARPNRNNAPERSSIDAICLGSTNSLLLRTEDPEQWFTPTTGVAKNLGACPCSGSLACPVMPPPLLISFV